VRRRKYHGDDKCDRLPDIPKIENGVPAENVGPAVSAAVSDSLDYSLVEICISVTLTYGMKCLDIPPTYHSAFI
jgi:hypothetical protein